MVSNIQRSEIVKDVILTKTEEEFEGEFQVMDQVNTYRVLNKLNLEIEIFIDITGSDGVAF
jgi:hypothetical protein